MIIVYVADENYLGFVEKSASSLLKIHPEAKIILVSPEKLNTSFQNVVIPINREFKHNENDRITSATYLKLFLTELPYDKILYLDGDTIIQKPSGDYTISDTMRARLKSWLGKQPSTGFMAIDICREAKAKSIDIYGFNKNVPTFYNPEGYITQHDYDTEHEILHDLEKHNILTFN